MNATRRRLAIALTLVCAALSALGPVTAHAAAREDDPATSAIEFYQRWLSDMRHFHCRYTPSCSQYAIDAIAAYGVVEGSARAADRLMRCNSAADSRYARGDDGLLSDPATGPVASATEVRAPAWLAPAPTADAPPVSARLSAGRSERFAETLEFARALESRGDHERASAELQRAAMLADTLPAHAWAFARAGDGYRAASQWLIADRGYLTAAMLSADPGVRADAGYRAALCRFDAGAYVACAHLLADTALVPPGEAGDAVRGRVAALAGTCAFALGGWDAADRGFAFAGGTLRDDDARARTARLATYVASGRKLPGRSPAVAGTLSAVLPGAGQAYAGHARDGLRHLLFNAAFVYTVVSLARHDEVPGALIVGGFELPFYLGNVIGARESARRFEREQRMRLLARAIDESSR